MLVNIDNGYTFKPLSYVKLHTSADLSSFRPDAEQVRALKFNPQSSGSTPVYDYEDGVVPKDDTVTPEIVALRSGKLDKADAEALKAKIFAEAKKSNDEAYMNKVQKAVENVLGISDSSSEGSQK